MECNVYFSEIQSLVREKSGRDVVLTAVNDKTVEVEAKVSAKIPLLGEITKNIGIQITVERVEEQCVHLSYDGGMGTDMIIGGLLTFIASTKARNMVEKKQNNGIIVHLEEIKEVKKALKMVKLTGITFREDAVVVEGQLRTV